MKKVSLKKMNDLIKTHWAPLDVFKVNDFTVKLVKIQGKYIWHKHPGDELFIVQKGQMIIHLEDCDVDLSEGEGFVVDQGILHQTEASNETEIMVIEQTDNETITD